MSIRDEARAEDFCDQCSGPYPLDSWPGNQYAGHWDTCPNRHSPTSAAEPSDAELDAAHKAFHAHVDVELARMVRGVERLAAQRVRESLVRLGVDVEAMERAEREHQRQETVAPWVAFGRALAELRLGMERFARAVSAGYEERMRRG